MKGVILAILMPVLFVAVCSAQGTARKVNNVKPKKEMRTEHLTKADFMRKVADLQSNPTQWKYLGDKPAIIDFYADWCAPCRTLAPILEELAAEYGDRLHVYKINVDNEQELAAMFGIRSIPSLLFIPMEGKPRMTQGVMSRSELEAAIKKLISK